VLAIFPARHLSVRNVSESGSGQVARRALVTPVTRVRVRQTANSARCATVQAPFWACRTGKSMSLLAEKASILASQGKQMLLHYRAPVSLSRPIPGHMSELCHCPVPGNVSNVPLAAFWPGWTGKPCSSLAGKSIWPVLDRQYHAFRAPVGFLHWERRCRTASPRKNLRGGGLLSERQCPAHCPNQCPIHDGNLQAANVLEHPLRQTLKQGCEIVIQVTPGFNPQRPVVSTSLSRM
jgi:hypothetical protein